MKRIFPFILILCINSLVAQFPCSTGFNGNGTDEFITVPNTDAINLQNTRDRTIEFWFKTSDITSKQVLYEEGGGTRAFTLYVESNKI